jgi:hypothetical protein
VCCVENLALYSNAKKMSEALNSNREAGALDAEGIVGIA